MKIWNGYGSEHSMNLVMIGRFKEVREAKRIKELIDKLTEQVFKEPQRASFELPPSDRRYSDTMYEILRSNNLNTVSPEELRQLGFDVTVSQEGKEISIWTDEIDVSAFLKIFIEKGARVEVFSAHDYPQQQQATDDVENQ